MKKLVSLIALLALTACESERTVNVRQPNGNLGSQVVKCIGVTGKGKIKGQDYDLSARNIIVGVVFFQILFIPPIVVLVKELQCPVGDTTTAPVPVVTAP